MENEDVIRQEMEETREAMTEKVQTLEKRLVDSVAETQSAAGDTMASAMKNPSEGIETPANGLDLPAQFERYPWLMIGGSILCGYAVGTFLDGKGTTPEVAPSPATGAAPPKNTETKSTVKDWLENFAPEIEHLQRLAVGITLGTVRELIVSEAPPHTAERLRVIIDEVTKKIGGETIPKSDFASAAPPTANGRGTMNDRDQSALE
jgi:hypothetical protein